MSESPEALEYTFPQLLKAMVDQNASDLHITRGSPPRFRLEGRLLSLELPKLTPTQTEYLCYSVLTAEQKKRFEEDQEIDISFNVSGLARFRANIYMQRGAVAGAFRVIPLSIKTLAQLDLPAIVQNLAELPRGLVLITGPTGSGKSTTMAAMLDHVNQSSAGHIITIEDPIEFIHSHKNCIVEQREVGTDTSAFSRALKSSLRQDPDLIMVGELRDLETISMALTAAETGHLVLATLHTNSCVASLTRIIDVFPSHQQAQVRTQLSFTLKGVLSQTLVKTIDERRTLAMEILTITDAIGNQIRENKFQGIYSAMQSGQGDTGMQTMNQALFNLVRRRQVSPNMALSMSTKRKELEEMMSQAGIINQQPHVRAR